MIRDGNLIYVGRRTFKRTPKQYESSYDRQVKNELRRIHNCKCFGSPKLKKAMMSFDEDERFWIGEMNKSDNNPPHKIRRSKKKYTKLRLERYLTDYIRKSYDSGNTWISKENIIFDTRCSHSMLDKLFMEFNRNGILSQAKHKRMHDSNRYPGRKESWEFGEHTDWASDYYVILKRP